VPQVVEVPGSQVCPGTDHILVVVPVRNTAHQGGHTVEGVVHRVGIVTEAALVEEKKAGENQAALVVGEAESHIVEMVA